MTSLKPRDGIWHSCYGVHQVLLPRLIGGIQGVCNVLSVTWHCDHSCSYHSSECFYSSHSSTAGRHWCGQVAKAMRWCWRPCWREGPLWICKEWYILLVVHFPTQAMHMEHILYGCWAVATRIPPACIGSHFLKVASLALLNILPVANPLNPPLLATSTAPRTNTWGSSYTSWVSLSH